MRFVPMVLAAFLLFPAIAGAQQLSAQNYSYAYANSTFSASAAYLSMVNESGYLIFYPNMTIAYRYLDMAQGNLTSNADLCVFYSIKAQSAAQAQYSNINYYRSQSLVVMAVFTIAVAVVLARIMIPVKRATKPKASRKRTRQDGR